MSPLMSRGRNARTLSPELLVDGKVVARGRFLVDDTLGIDLQRVDSAASQRGVVVVRDISGGPELARDDAIAPQPSTMSCG